MRFAAVAGLLAAAGCDQIFGIDKAALRDAPPPPVAGDVYVHALWADTALDVAIPVISTPKLSTAPAMMVGLLDSEEKLAPIAFEADGLTLHVPAEVFSAVDKATSAPIPWRLQLSDPSLGPVPVEVQWRPLDKTAHFVADVEFRHPTVQMPTPAGSGFLVKTGLGTTYQHNNTHVFTTGVWTDKAITFPDPGPDIDYDFSDTTTLLSGVFGSTTTNDIGIAYDYGTDGSCRFAASGAGYPLPALVAGMHSAVTTSWNGATATTESFDFSLFDASGTASRFTAALGVLAGNGLSVHVRSGQIPSTHMPSFTHQETGGGSLALPVPLMITLVECAVDPASPRLALPMHTFASLGSGLPSAVHLQFSSTRMIPGTSVTVAPGMETTVTDEPFVTNVPRHYSTNMPVAIPTGITLHAGSASADLSGQSGTDAQTNLAIGTAPLSLEITPEVGVLVAADYYEIVLYEVEDATLVPVREYVSATPRVQIEASRFAVGSKYLFSVRALRGFPLASINDFTMVSYPQSAVLLYSRAFLAE